MDHEKEVLLGFLDAEREHVLKETAAHAGHLDAAAGFLGGRQ